MSDMAGEADRDELNASERLRLWPLVLQARRGEARARSRQRLQHLARLMLAVALLIAFAGLVAFTAVTPVSIRCRLTPRRIGGVQVGVTQCGDK